MSGRKLPMPTNERADEAVSFRHEQRSSARLSFWIRAVALVAIAGALAFRLNGQALTLYLVLLLVLLGNGWLIQYLLRHLAGRRQLAANLVCAALIAVDMSLITAALVFPAPGAAENWTAAMQLRVGNVGFLFVFLVFSSVSYSPWLAVWSGVCAGLAWICAALWALGQPDAFTRNAADFAAMDTEALIGTLLHPDYVSLIRAGQDAVLLAISGAVVAVAVWRGRLHVRRQIREARDRTTLARYFSPDVVAELTARRSGFIESRTPDAAVIFADIVGFTTQAEQESPEEVLDFLREFHRRATGAVFAHGGTLNKFIGDEVMASFGAIHDVETPAASALECTLAMAEAMRDWSRTRIANGQTPVRVGIGAHFGPVVVGNIGNDSILELAVLGDSVNVASRLQKKTRSVDAEVVASQRLIEAAVQEKPELSARIADFEAIEEEALKGRSGAIPALKLSLR